MLEVKSIQTGYLGAPGFTSFNFERLDGAAATQADVDNAVSRVVTFWDTVKSLFPTPWHCQVQQAVRDVVPATGALTAIFSATDPPPAVNGSTAFADYAGPVGGLVRWNTTETNSRGLIHGRTFLIPFRGGAFDSGAPGASNLLTMNAAAAGLSNSTTEGGLRMVIWVRPKAGTGGRAIAVTGAESPAFSAVLTSRRT